MRFLKRLTAAIAAALFIVCMSPAAATPPLYYGNTVAAGLPRFDPRYYGAKCDWNGTTGTDDHVAFQAALTAATAANGALYLPSGVNACYTGSTTLTCGQNCVIVGDGPGSILRSNADPIIAISYTNAPGNSTPQNYPIVAGVTLATGATNGALTITASNYATGGDAQPQVVNDVFDARLNTHLAAKEIVKVTYALGTVFAADSWTNPFGAGAPTANFPTCLSLNGASATQVKAVDIEDCGIGISAKAVGGNADQGLTVSNSFINGNYNGVSLQNEAGFQFTGNTVDSNYNSALIIFQGSGSVVGNYLASQVAANQNVPCNSIDAVGSLTYAHNLLGCYNQGNYPLYIGATTAAFGETIIGNSFFGAGPHTNIIYVNKMQNSLIAENVMNQSATGAKIGYNAGNFSTSNPFAIRGNFLFKPGYLSLGAFPATTVAYTNPTPYDLFIEVQAGAAQVGVSIDGTAGNPIPAGQNGFLILLVGSSVTFTYTGSPSWTQYAIQ